MARKERITLEPGEVAASGRVEVVVHHESSGDGSIRVGKDGPDWGDYEVNAFMAKQRMGLEPVDAEIPNRTIVIPLLLGATGDFDAARIAVEAWAADVNHRGGGHLKREIVGGSYGEAGKKLFSDCVKATLSFGGGTAQARDGIDNEAVLTIEALPGFYGEREVEEPFEATGGGTQTLQVQGTLPPRAELQVTDKSGKEQMAVYWFARRDHYSAAATAAWRYEAEALQPLDTATEVSLTGASGGKAIRHNNLGTNWTPVCGLRQKDGTYLTHAGLYDVYARVYTTSLEMPWLRLLYDTGDLVAPASEPQVQVPERSALYLVHLGQVYLEPTPFGEHRWQGVIQARGEVGGENIYIDQVEFHCADEGSAIVAGRVEASEPFAASYLVRDEFNQGGGNATGKSPAAGSAYAALANSDADDFTIDSTGHRLKRVSVSDSGTIGTPDTWKGRGIGGSAEATNVALRARFEAEGATLQGWSTGFVVSYVNDSNFMIAQISFGSSGWYLNIYRADNNGEGYSRPLKVQLPDEGAVAGEIAAVVRGNRLTFFCAREGEKLREEASIENAMIGPKGKAFLYDENNSANAITRYWDDFSVWVPEGDAAIFPNQDIRLSHLGAYRKSEDGKSYGPVSDPGTDLFRLPVSGPEEKPVEVGVRVSRGNLGTLADSGLDPFEAQVAYYPCWSQVPGL